MNKFFLTGIVLWMMFPFQLFSQELLFPLNDNPVIKEYISKNNGVELQSLRRSQSAVSLPFLDDFSGAGIYPDAQLWNDSDAFVNQNYPDDPITIGVATLDGINKLGNPHDSGSTSATPRICDYLTSLPIDLSIVSPSDSVYFSFYYQPQGNGDEPEDGDSLVLEFYRSNGVDTIWEHVWVANGKPDTAFAEARIKLLSANYFWNGFQFRFYNYANPNGNRDHWHIDYVSLKVNGTYNESLREITLVNPVPSYLKEFSAMPYSHYKSEVAAGRNPVKDTISDIVKLYAFTGTTSLALNDTVRTRQGVVTFGAQSAPDLNPVPNSTDVFIINLPSDPTQIFDTTSGHMTDFMIQHSFSGLAAGDTSNDKSYGTQHFYNYYSYDDGSAESATGVHVMYTSYAYKYDVKKADSLLGIQIYFNPWGKNVHPDLFSICLWDNVNVGTNSATLVYQNIDLRPANNDSINGFIDYYFDVPQYVSAGEHYFGITQNSINEIGLGVDHNTDAHDKMFLNFNNQWVQSTITGSWMMRPIFGQKLTIGINEITSADEVFDVFPNPSSDNVTIRLKVKGVFEIQLCNILGETVFNEPSVRGSRTQINVSTLPSGIYFVKVTDASRNFSVVKKLVVSH